ncbi:unnamed protein product, partial [Meganyctiphanes norvegica]
DRYINQGEILAVTCSIFHEKNNGPNTVVWYQGAARLDYDSPRGGIALQTEKTATKTVSKVMLSNVTPRDSGKYTCRPDTGGYASVDVHVKTGDHGPSPVQMSGYNASINATQFIHFVFLLSGFTHVAIILLVLR